MGDILPVAECLEHNLVVVKVYRQLMHVIYSTRENCTVLPFIYLLEFYDMK